MVALVEGGAGEAVVVGGAATVVAVVGSVVSVVDVGAWMAVVVVCSGGAATGSPEDGCDATIRKPPVAPSTTTRATTTERRHDGEAGMHGQRTGPPSRYAPLGNSG